MPKPKGNAINPNKLLLSKWTTQTPVNKEKHFLVTEIERNDAGFIETCTLEAVLTHRCIQCDWRHLKDNKQWQAGWH